jgi:3-hydroxy-9,10-secoandrosta-1,3,5(10)-triene-9,17-dione monooxygenase
MQMEATKPTFTDPLAPTRPSALVATATDVAAELAKRAMKTIAARRLLPENVALLKESGLLRVLQPKRCGGHETSMHEHIDVVAAIAKGCGSTGWCAGVYHAHSWAMGLFGADAQGDVYGKDSNAIVSAVIGPRGRARKVPGGYRLNGFWPFCSGVHHAQWALLGEFVEADDGSIIDSGVMLVPTGDLAIQDDWYVSNLIGTGSNSVVVKDVFVPEHRFLSMPKMIEGTTSGAGLHSTNLYYSAAVPALALFICSPAIGMARHAINGFATRLPGKVVSYTFDEKQIDMPMTHMQVAEAATKADAANTILHAMVNEMEGYAAKREGMPFLRRAKARMDCAYAVRLCLEAADAIVYAAGGSALAETNEVQMAARDLRGVNAHGLLNLQVNQEMYGRAVLGLPPSSPVV